MKDPQRLALFKILQYTQYTIRYAMQLHVD